jgi:hypothetical protein
MPPEVNAALATAGGIALLISFARIKSPEMRRQVIGLVGSIADLGEARDAPPLLRKAG